MKILVIDDSRFSRMLLKKELKYLEAGVEILEAESAKEGIHIFDRESPDMVITDMVMPEMDGLEVVKYVRSKNQDCFVAMLSANVQERVQREVADLGADMFVEKPVKGKKVYSILNEYAKKSEASI